MPKLFDRTPPQNIEAERAVLGCLFLNNDTIPTAVELLGDNGGTFYVDAHGKIFAAMMSLYSKGSPVDFVTLSEHLTQTGEIEKVGGINEIAALTDAVPTSANIKYYAEIVREMWRRREVIAICARTAGELYNPGSDTDEHLSALESDLLRITRRKGASQTSCISDLLPGQKTYIENIMNGEPLRGIRTGIRSLDEVLRPFSAGDFVIVGARPSVGKSTFAVNVGMKMAKAGTGVLFLSLEMPKAQIVQKMIGIEGSINMRLLEKQMLLKAPTERALSAACSTLECLPFYIDFCPGLSTMEMRGKVRDAIKEHNIGIVFIDYLQIMTAPKAENRTNEVAEISKAIMRLAGEAEIPIVALSQLNREGVDQPKLSNLRDGGALEQDGGIVIFLYKDTREAQEDKYAPVPIWVDVQKQRLGECDRVKMLFDKPFQQFKDLSREGEPDNRHYQDDEEPFPEDSYSEDYANANELF